MKEFKMEQIKKVLLQEVEEEDIGISLLLNFYQNEDELCFFSPTDRMRIKKILRTLSEDSYRHKEILMRILESLEDNHEKPIS